MQIYQAACKLYQESHFSKWHVEAVHVCKPTGTSRQLLVDRRFAEGCCTRIDALCCVWGVLQQGISRLLKVTVMSLPPLFVQVFVLAAEELSKMTDMDELLVGR